MQGMAQHACQPAWLTQGPEPGRALRKNQRQPDPLTAEAVESMVISAETASRPPDPSSVAAMAPSRGETQGNLLHNFSFPDLKTWGNQRLLRCINVNRKGDIIRGGGGRRSAAEGGEPRILAPGEDGKGDAGLEEVRDREASRPPPRGGGQDEARGPFSSQGWIAGESGATSGARAGAVFVRRGSAMESEDEKGEV